MLVRRKREKRRLFRQASGIMYDLKQRLEALSFIHVRSIYRRVNIKLMLNTEKPYLSLYQMYMLYINKLKSRDVENTRNEPERTLRGNH